MAGVLGRAFVQVFADLSKFTPDLKKNLKKALNESVKDEGIERALTDKAEKTGKEYADKLGEGIDKESKTRMKKSGEKAGFSFMAGLRGVMGAVVAGFLPTVIALGVELASFLAPAAVALGATIPAAIASAVASAVVLKMAFSGVGDAIKAAFSGDPQKLAEAMKKLAPAARSFVGEIQRARPVVHALQQEIQQAFFVQFRGAVTELVTKLLPRLHGGLVQVATDLGRVGRNIVSALSGGTGSRNLAGIVGTLHQVLSAVGPALVAMTSGFLTLANAAGPFIVTLTTGFANALMNLNDFIQIMANTGGLTDFFNTALVLLRQLGGLLVQVVGLFAAIGSALQASGGQSLGILTNIVMLLNQFFSTPEGQQALASLFTLLNTLLQTIFDTLTPLLPLIGQLVTDISGGLVVALQKLNPYLSDAAKFLAQNKQWVEIMIGLWAAYRVAAYAAATAQAVLDAAMAANVIGLFIIAIIASIAVVATLAYLWIHNWDKAKSGLINIWRAIAGFFEDIWNDIVSVWDSVIGWFTGTLFPWFDALPGRIWDAIKALPGILWQAFLTMMHDIGELVGIGVGLVIGFFVIMPGRIWSAIKALPGLLADVFTAAWDWIWNITTTYGERVWNWVKALPGRLWDGIRALPGLLGRVFEDAWNWIKGAFTRGADWVVDFARKLPGRIAGFFSNVGHEIFGGLKSAINSAISGFNSGIDSVAHTLHIGLPHIPLLASGGLISSPTLAVVGEAGPEAVTPMSSPQKAVQSARRTGLLDMLSGALGRGKTVVQVFLGTREITDILDVRIKDALAGEAQDLAYGTR